MNIWMINHYAGNLELGMEYRHFFLARHLERMGHKVGIISSSFHHLYTTPPEVEDQLTFRTVENVPFAWIKAPHYLGNNLGRLKNMLVFTWKLRRHYRAIEAQFGKPDVVLGSSPHPFVVLNLLHLKKVYKAPVLFEVRDLWPLMLIELGSLSPSHPLSMLFAWLERKAFKKCDRVISLWHTADDYMYKHGLTPDRYYYLPNGIELAEDGTVGEVDDTHDLIAQVRALGKAGKFLIGYAGSHGLANPLSSMVETSKLLQDKGIDDVAFFLVGAGPCKEETVAKAREYGLKNIHFHPYVQKNVIMAFYREIDVAFMGLRDLPLFKYGPTPNKLMDYLASARPVIYAINSSFNPIEEIGAGKTVVADDVEGLYQAILELKALPPEELEKMGQAGLKYAREELNFKVLAAKLVDLAQTCIDEKGTR